MEILTTVLIILVFARIFGEIFARIRQPSIIGEMIAGIILGPSILNLISPEVKGIDILAEFGVFFLLFLAGMQMQLASFKEYSRPAIWIALMGNNLAILSGIAVGKIFSLDFLSSLFVGVVFSLTALPVGIRILMDLGKMDTSIGKIIVTSAVIDDIFSIVFLAIVLSIAEGDSKNPDAGFLFMLIIKIVMFILIINYINKLLTIKDGPQAHCIKLFFSKLTKESQFFAVLVFGIFTAYIGGLLGITFIIGIFYAGILIKNITIGEEAYSNVYNVVSSITFGIFSPIFFVYLGLLLDISPIFDHVSPFSTQNLQQGIFLLTAILFAMVGKSGGAFIGGILANMKLKDAIAVGIGLNARGLMGLVISGIGLKYGLIDMNVYTMLVTMCIITTFITPYGLKRILK